MPRALVLNRQQLRDITMDDKDLMREVIEALISYTKQNLPLLEQAVRDKNVQKTMRLAQYFKGASTKCGAKASAATFKEIEYAAASQNFGVCQRLLETSTTNLENLRQEATAL